MGVLLIATENADKAREISRILADTGVELVMLNDLPGVELPEEAGATLEENAVLKARAAFEATGLAAVADDTGLEVDALGGRPGVFSARYAGENVTYGENRRHLLEELAGIEEERRRARFVTVIALYRGDGRILLFRGEAEGRILETERGTSGFGYDPVFYSFAGKKTFAEMTAEEKARYSHRGAALRQLRAHLKETAEEQADPTAKAAPTDGLGHLVGQP